MTLHALRDSLLQPARRYRPLSDAERNELKASGNHAQDWNTVLVEDGFVPGRVRNCRFEGMVRIGASTVEQIEFDGLRRPVGVYDSFIQDCDLGRDVLIDGVRHLSQTIVQDGAVLLNVGEVSCPVPPAAFPIDLWNENGGRSILANEGMLLADAYLWAKRRDDRDFIQRMQSMATTDLPPYSVIGSNCVVQNANSLRRVRIGDSARVIGADRLHNVFVQSCAEAPVEIGEGAHIENAVIGEGCRVLSHAIVENVLLCPFATLQFGARVIHSVVGENSQVFCCEVLSSLIFPFHVQHHNNSFLISSCVEGQSNIAAGATIGSNNNSRAFDGELYARRGFWPGLCVSLKHNSRFASFTLLAKGAYPAELDIRLPYSLVANDETHGMLTVMPGYWATYNYYALARTTYKFARRDRRINKPLDIEFGFVAPDTIEEMFEAMALLDQWQGDGPEMYGQGMEKSKRKTLILKPDKGREAYRHLILEWCVRTLLGWMQQHDLRSIDHLRDTCASAARQPWINLGGQLATRERIERLCNAVRKGEVASFEDLHAAYRRMSAASGLEKVRYAWAALRELHGQELTTTLWHDDLQAAAQLAQSAASAVRQSRAKDFDDPFRQMSYDNAEEMNAVLGSIESDDFIRQFGQEAQAFSSAVQNYLSST